MLVNEFLENSVKNSPGKIALVCQNRRWTFSEINSAADSLANALNRAGLKKQDRAAIYLENSAESVVSIFAILKASGVFVVVNPQVKAGKLEYILNDCQVKILITDTHRLQDASKIIPNCPHLKAIIITDYERLGSPLPQIKSQELLSYSVLLKNSTLARPSKRGIDIDLAGLIYTSGSTGSPKGVMLTHLNMVSAANSITEYLENTSGDIIIDCLPLSFDYGLYQVLMAFKFGGTVVLERSFTYPYQIINLIIKEKVTGFPLVPAISAILLQLKNLKQYNLSSLRYITNTAQALPPKHIFSLRELFPHVKIYSMYGLTECKRVAYLDPSQAENRPSSVGKAMPNVEVFIVDEEGRKITQPGQIGELVIRGANVMKGYWNLPELTAQRLKPGPWDGEKLLYSGDYFKTDEEGYLYFVSRKDDIIKTAGEMVSPKEVENVLYEMDGIVEAAVVGIPDEILGNAVKAFVVLADGFRLTDKDIILHCQEHLESFMVPKSIEFREELPKTSTGKLKKAELIKCVE